MPPTTLDFSNAYMGITDIIRGLDLLGGKPKKIGEGIFFPSTTANQGAPYAFIATDGEMGIDWDSGPVQQCQITIPVTVWYVRAHVASSPMAQMLRDDGSRIALAFWRSKLPHDGADTVNKCVPTGIDWSDSNSFNEQAAEQGWPLCAVAVRLELHLSVPK